VYYGLRGARIVLLLCGGDKSSQSVDIDRAVQAWKQVQEDWR
jgi:putative addiction module killer protein